MHAPSPPGLPDQDALFVALVVAPGTYSRNKFFELYRDESLQQARRRAQLVRSIVKDLTEPWPHPGEIPPHPAPVIEEEREVEGEYHLTYAVAEFGYRRQVMLHTLEAAALRYALCRARGDEVSSVDRTLIEGCLSRLTTLQAADQSADTDASEATDPQVEPV